MRKFITLAFLLFPLSAVFSQPCTHTLRMTDTFGDGWNGGTVTVTVNGTPVLTNVTLASGYGPSDLTFSASTGSTVNVTRTNAGTYPTEMRIEVFGPGGTVIPIQQPTATPGVNGTGNCGIGGCSHTLRMTDTFGDGWNGGTVTVTVNGTPVLTNVTLASGYGPSDLTFSASTGSTVNVTRTNAGTYPTEMRIEVFGPGGTVIPIQQPPATPGVSGVGNCGANMAYVSSTCTQNNTSSVAPGSTTQEIIGIQIVTSGSSNPLSVTSFTVNANGTTSIADINTANSAKIYYTGTSSVFATTTLFGQNTPTIANFNITGSQTLSNGVNYFWLVYDIKPGATIGNVVDGQCASLNVGGARTPTVTAPAGSRTIVSACTHTLRMTDTFGDGWNGGTVTVTVGGIPVLTNVTLASGTGPSDLTFSAATGSTINVTCTNGGTYPTEMRIQVLGPTGTLIVQQQPPLAPGVNGTGDCGSPMVFVSSTTTQNNTSAVATGANAQEIIGIQIVTSGSSSPLSATSFTVNANGTTSIADIDAVNSAKIYYTGTSSTFATTTLFGQNTPTIANFNITGTQALAGGTNYFWLVYDIKPGATVGNVVDGRCVSLNVGGVRTPTVTAPAGNRPIVSACTHTLRLWDTYGDGWQGGTVTLYVNGIPTISNILLATGAGPADTTFLAPPGATINVTRILDGSYPSEMQIAVLGPVSTIISQQQPPTAPGISGVADCGTPMVFVSTTCTQPNTTNVAVGTNNSEIICVQVVVNGALSPFTMTQMLVNMTGTTSLADVVSLDIYYTGTSSTFATTTLFGSIAPGGGTLTVNGSQILSSGTNYFWIAYDVFSAATAGNLVDAQCTQMTMTGGGGVRVPTITNPAGSRTIYEPCPHYIRLTDTFGDGWQGGTVTVTVGGVPVLTNISFATGYGPVDFAFNAGTGEAINVTLTAGGSFPNELRFEVLGPFGAAIIPIMQPVATPGTNGTGNCICPSPLACATYNDPPNAAPDVMPTGVNLSWTSVPDALGYKLYFGTNTPPTNLINGINVGNVTAYHTGTLAVNTTYYWKIVPTNCSGDAAGCTIWSFTTINETRWTGLVSTEWTNPGNWSAGVPTAISDAVIPFKTNNPGQWRPTLNDNSGTCRHIILEKGGILNASDKILTVHGNWKNCYGTFNYGTGTVTFTGLNDGYVTGYNHPVFIVSNTVGTTAVVKEHESNGSTIYSGDDRGLLIVNRDYVYVTGDQRTVRMDVNLSAGNPVNLAHKRDGMFVDLLTGKLYSMYNTTSGVPVWPLVDGQMPEYAFTCNAIIELDPLSLDTIVGSCIRLTNTGGAYTSFTCKGGQNFSYIYRTGLFSGYGFLGIFCDQDGGFENMYVLDIPSGVLFDYGHKNITPNVEQSDSWAFSGISEFDGTDYYVVYRDNGGDLIRINMSTLTESTLMSFSNLGDCANVAYSPWLNRWYFHWEGLTQYGGNAGSEYVGFITGSHITYDPERDPEPFNHFVLTKNAGKKTILNVPISVNNMLLTTGQLDVNTENNYIQLRGSWTNNDASNAFIPRLGEVRVEGTTGVQRIKGSQSTTFYNLTKNSDQNMIVADAAANSAEVIVSNNFNWIDNNDTTWIGSPVYTAIFDVPAMYVDNNCALKMTSFGTLEVKRHFTLTNSCTFAHGNGRVIMDGSMLGRIQRVGDISVWSDLCNSLAGWTSSGWALVDPAPGNAPNGPADDNTGGGNCFITNGTATYANATTYQLTSPTINLSTITSTGQLGFWMYMNTEGSTSFWDGGYLEISADNGGSWTKVDTADLNLSYDGPLDNTYGNPLGGQNAWSFDHTTWTHVLADIPLGFYTSTFKFRFTFGSDNTTQTGTGWAIDDCEVTGTTAASTQSIIFGYLETKKTGGMATLMNKIATDNDCVITSGTFDAGAAKSISVKGHWLNTGGIFNHNLDTVTFNGILNSNIRANASPFYNLVINNGAGVSLIINNTTVAHKLTFTNGRINTAALWMYVENDTVNSIVGHSDTRYINGNLRRKVLVGNNYDLPVGTSTMYEYARIDLNNISAVTHLNAFFTPFGGVFGTIGAGMTHNGSPLTSMLDYGFWTIYPNAGGTSTDYDVTLTSRGHSNGGTAADQHTAMKRDNAIDTWELYGAHFGASGTGTNPISVERTQINGFSDHAIARNDSPLPVELLTFEGMCMDGRNIIYWSTASETNSSHFKLFHSPDGSDWSEVGIVAAAGYSNQLLYYSLQDDNPFAGTSYYQLLQFDNDGQWNTYGPISVNCEQTETEIDFVVYPNPFNEQIIVSFSKDEITEASVLIWDMIGNRVYEHSLDEVELLLGFAKIDLSWLAAGVYSIEFNSGEFSKTLRIIRND